MAEKNATEAQTNGNETNTAEKQATDNYLNLKVKSQVTLTFCFQWFIERTYFLKDGEEVFFKIKKTTQFKKLMDAYCNRQQVILLLFQ